MEIAGVGILCLCGMLYFLSRIPKRTEETLDVYIKIKGLVNFIKHASSEEIDKLSEENPNYFYDILPFAYVLDMSDELLKKFKDIPLQMPNWYIYSDEAIKLGIATDFVDNF